MGRKLTIPHQHVTLTGGDQGTLRAELTVSADGNAHGHLALTSRQAALQYRAIGGAIQPESHMPAATVQLEESRLQPGLEELAELTVERIPASACAAFRLTRLPDGEEIARGKATIIFEPEV
jgi:hypothetical protein